MRPSKFDARRQPREPAARRSVILTKRIGTGLLLVAVVIFLALVIGGIFQPLRTP